MDNLKTMIRQYITTNGNQEITGQNLQSVLLNIVDAISNSTVDSIDGYSFKSTATPSTTPITLTGDENVFYIATEEGDYANFGLGDISELSIIKSVLGSWSVEGLGVPFNAAKKIELGGLLTYSPGSETDTNTRARTHILTPPFRIEVKDGYSFKNLNVYDKNESFIEYRPITSRAIEIRNSTNEIYRITFQKDDGSNFDNDELDNVADIKEGLDFVKDIPVIKLKNMGSSVSIDVGEYAYRTDLKKLRYNQYETDGVVDVPLSYNCVYIYNNSVYLYNGDTLVNITQNAVVDTTENVPLEVELGGLLTYSPGSETDTNTRARTSYIQTPFSLKVNDGYYIRCVNYYIKTGDTFTYRRSDILNGFNIKSYISNEYDLYCRLSFQKIIDTDIISNEDLENLIDKYEDKFAFVDNVDKLKSSHANTYISAQYLSKYSSYEKIIEDYDKIMSDYPDFVSRNNLGQTSLGTPIYEYVYSMGSYNSDGRRNPDTEIPLSKILVMAGIHGYEPGATMALLSIIKDYCNGNSALSKLRNYELHIIPCVNPDGYNSGTRGNSNSVDLNRNFDDHWSLQGEGTDYYGGSSAASENETQIVQNWLSAHQDAVFAIDFHQSSFNNEIAALGDSQYYTIEGEDTLKKTFLVTMRKIANNLILIRDTDYNFISYSFKESNGGTLVNYMGSLGIKGGILEVPENISNSGNNSILTIATAADILGNILIDLSDIYTI